MFGTLDISASALTAHRAQLDVIAGNIAMKDVTRDDSGRAIPYRRRVPLFSVGNKVVSRSKIVTGVKDFPVRLLK